MTPNARGSQPESTCTRIPTWVTRLNAIASLALTVGATSAAAQPRKASPSDDLRPAYATSADVAEGKRVADGLCARCHGAAGISATSAVPHVAGQRPSYLYTKIKAYQSGARDDHTMEGAVKFLIDDARVKVAAY